MGCVGLGEVGTTPWLGFPRLKSIKIKLGPLVHQKPTQTQNRPITLEKNISCPAFPSWEGDSYLEGFPEEENHLRATSF